MLKKNLVNLRWMFIAALAAPLAVIANGCSGDSGGDDNGSKDASSDALPSDGSNSDTSTIVEDPDTGPKTCTMQETIPTRTTCNECLSNNCCDTVKACQDDSDCLAFFNCVETTCDGGASCTGTCASGKKQGSLELFQAMASCAGKQCGDGGVKQGCPFYY